LVDGGSLAIGWIKENIPGIIHSWYSGQEGGNAVADVLFGDYNPSGRLPMTFYNSIDDLPSMDDYDITKGRTYQYFKGKPLYAFGYGLSYTNFVYSDATLSDIDDERKINLHFKIKNTGERDGAEVAQVYITLPKIGIVTPIKQLKGFKRVFIAKGKEEIVDIQIDISSLRYWDEISNKFKVPNGIFEIKIGASSDDIRLETYNFRNVTIN
jgi:beta-glucosidase